MKGRRRNNRASAKRRSRRPVPRGPEQISAHKPCDRKTAHRVVCGERHRSRVSRHQHLRPAVQPPAYQEAITNRSGSGKLAYLMSRAWMLPLWRAKNWLKVMRKTAAVKCAVLRLVIDELSLRRRRLMSKRLLLPSPMWPALGRDD